jgi:hypothetical protein
MQRTLRCDPIQVSQWKRQLLDGAIELFIRGKQTKDKDEVQAKVAELFQQIGRLQMELEWLKKSLSCSDARELRKLVRSRPPRSQRQPPMRAAWSGSIHAVLPAYTGAGIDIADHGQNRCSLPGRSLQRQPQDGGLPGQRWDPDQP